HTWSLAVEEQFYFLWPPLLRWGLRKTSVLRLVIFTTVAALACIAWRIHLVNTGATVDRVYCGFDTRFDCLAAGSITGLLMSRKLLPAWFIAIVKNEWLMWAMLAGFLYIGASFVSEDTFMLKIGHTLVSLVTCCLICGLLSSDASSVERFLSSAPLVWI